MNQKGGGEFINNVLKNDENKLNKLNKKLIKIDKLLK